MNVSCPQCKQPYKLDESRIPANGQRMRCPKCAFTFRVFADGHVGEATSMNPAGATATMPARPSVAPKRPQRGPRPTGLSEPPSAATRAADADLPAPKGGGGFDFDLDLPAPLGAADLPAPKGGPDPFGDLDLPTPARTADLPAPKAAPKSSFVGDIPAPDPDDPFGDADLPTPVAAADLPAPKAAPEYEDPFGDLDLPTPSRAADLPAPKYEDPFGEIDLPTPSGGVDLPTPSGGVDLPTPSSAIGLPAPVGISDVPEPVAGVTGLPSRSIPPIPSIPSAEFPAAFPAPPTPAPRGPDPGASRQRVQSSGTTDFGEIDLGGAPEQGRGEDEFDGFPVADDSSPSIARDGGGFGGIDLAESPHERLGRGSILDTAPAEAKERDRKGGKFEGRRKYERQSRKLRSTLLALLLLLVGAGGALYFTDLGPFGVYFIADLLPNAAEEKIVGQVVAKSEKRLKDDTYAALDEALYELETARRDYADNEDLKLFGVFMHNWVDIHFGGSEAHIDKATRLLGRVDLDKSGSRYAPLAKASRDLVATRAADAVKTLAAIGKPAPEELALLVEAHLAGGDADKAALAVEKLAGQEQSARALFLAARVAVARGDRDAAIEGLELLVEEHPRHAGSRLLLAALLLQGDRALGKRIAELLEPVVAAKDASRPEKARANALLGRARLRSREFQQAAAAFDAAKELKSDDVDLLVGRGFLALSQDDLTGAIAFFVKARAIDPANVDAKLGHADAMSRQDLLGDAKTLVAEVLPANPDNAYAHYLMGRLNLALKSYEPAEKELDAAVRLDKQLVEAYVALSDLYTATGRDEAAMRVLDKAGAAAPGSALIKLTLADAYAARGDYATAIVALSDALDAEPDNVRTHFRMAQMYLKLGSASDAGAALGEVAARDPSYPGLALEQGRLLESTGKVAEALAAYERALAATPDDANAKLRVGAASIAVRDFAKAEPMLAAAVAAMPKSAEANFQMGELLRLTERAAEALSYLRAAAELDAKNALYHLRLGMAMMATHDMTRAMVEVEQARALDPKLAEAPLRVGEIKLRTGSARDAIALFEEALTKDPRLAEAYGLIGEACEELADFGAALKYYQRAVAALPDDATLNFKLGVTALQTIGATSALAPLAKAVALADTPGATLPPWLPEAYYRLGVLQQTAGQRPAAIASFQRYLAVAPEKAIDRAEVSSRLEQLGAAPPPSR